MTVSEELRDDVTTVYADTVQINASAATIMMEFGINRSWLDGATPASVVRILTSPIHFKLMTRIMPEILRRYEADFGEIPDVPITIEEAQIPPAERHRG